MARYEERFQGKGQEFTIRNAMETDGEAMIRYMSYVDRETTFLSREPGEFERFFPLERERKFLKECEENPGHLFLVALLPGGEVIASCDCSFGADKIRYRHRAKLGISVRRDFWRQGLGRRLMEIQEDWCRSQGIEKLCLEVDTQNIRAIGLYLSRGFVVEGTLRREVKLPDGSYRDLYAMGKFLDR